LLLASRGARVVVNDLGGSIQGVGSDAGVAAGVVAEIVDAGGTAVADTHDISSVDGAGALIGSAVDAFGRVDVLINNAGIMQWAGPPEVDVSNIERHLAVHVLGSFNTARAAWPRFVEQEYGRIVMTTSTGVFGLPNNVGYATAKGGVIGLARSLATAGAACGVKVNCIAPAAFTRMAGEGVGAPEMAPELVAPMVAYLAHEECPVNGEIYTAGFGRFARLFVGSTPGYVSTDASVEDVVAHWAEINDERAYSVPRDLTDWSRGFMGHLG
jgi:NAD(P)-dependent dehydrogenase (short-subunit alcohol dehydrogenase family)